MPEGAIHKDTNKPKTYYASLVQDALCQFLDDDPPLTSSEADNLFLEIMGKYDFSLRCIYYATACVFGEGFRRVAKWTCGAKGTKSPTTSANTSTLAQQPDQYLQTTRYYGPGYGR